jgi:superfamily I DNA/RNA helicase
MISIPSKACDVIIVDEAQDFSANQLRAINHHLAEQSYLTLVLDTAQRLYPRGYTWSEIGLNMMGARYHRLKQNHRNTVEIARFAAGLLTGLALDDDATLPDLSATTRSGALPRVVVGTYPDQVREAISFIKANVDLERETVGFLHPLGWFKGLKPFLIRADLDFVDLTKGREWPRGPENIALSTMHSAKGLEFDHVIILGLDADTTPHGDAQDSDDLITVRRLLGMAVGRARTSLLLGYAPNRGSDLINYFQPGTFVEQII